MCATWRCKRHRQQPCCRCTRPAQPVVNRLLAPIAVLASLVFTPPAAAQRPPLVVPEHSNALVGHLPRGYSRLEPVAAAAPGVDHARSNDLQLAARLLEAASMTGDARLVARADALLSRQPERNGNPNLLRLRAYSAQHRHDFSDALRLLDEVLASQPRDAGARLSRAEIQLVQGRVDKARDECRALALGIDVDAGLLCAASVALRVADYATARVLLDRALAGMVPLDPRRSFALLTRAEVASRGGDADADARYRQALAASPADIRIRVSYARYLRRVGRAAEVEPLLVGSEQSDTAQLQRTLAALAAKSPQAQTLAIAQGHRYAQAHVLGTPPEIRDEAEFLLVVKRQPREALALALRNFTQQRDYEDVDILVRAADAAGDASALQGLHAWQRAAGLASADMQGHSQ